MLDGSTKHSYSLAKENLELCGFNYLKKQKHLKSLDIKQKHRAMEALLSIVIRHNKAGLGHITPGT